MNSRPHNVITQKNDKVIKMKDYIDFKITEKRILKVRKLQEKENVKKVRNPLGKQKCNICNYKTNLEFLSYGKKKRPNEKCPNCYSFKRTRTIWFYITKYTDFLEREDIKILHTAPESSLYKTLKSRYGDNYISSDIVESQYVDEIIDAQNIPYDDNSLDLIITSHVLEHIPDDQKALEEFYRVLKNNGQLVMMIPTLDELEKTFEVPQINTDNLRQRYYKQFDHQRYYGRDVFDKLEEAGFKALREMKYELLKYTKETMYHNLAIEPIFIGIKKE